MWWIVAVLIAIMLLWAYRETGGRWPWERRHETVIDRWPTETLRGESPRAEGQRKSVKRR